MDERWLTIKQAAELLNIAPTTLRDMVTRGEIQHRRPFKNKVTGPVRFAPEDIAAFKERSFVPAITATPSRVATRVRRAASQRKAA